MGIGMVPGTNASGGDGMGCPGKSPQAHPRGTLGDGNRDGGTNASGGDGVGCPGKSPLIL